MANPNSPPTLTFTTGRDARTLDHQLQRLLGRSKRVAIVVAFAQCSGVEHIADRLRAALACGGTVRILTGDYCDITDPEALHRLLDLAAEYPGLTVRVVETSLTAVSFHPKS